MNRVAFLGLAALGLLIHWLRSEDVLPRSMNPYQFSGSPYLQYPAQPSARP